MNRIIKLIAMTVNLLLIADLASELYNKYKDWKAQKLATVPATEEEPAPETE